jgi:predicted transcriptional regulator
MSARRLNIGIRSDAERSQALRKTMRSIGRGDLSPQEPALFFENVENFRRILTDRRLALLLAITKHRPASVRELAGLLGRNYKNVSGDIDLLERLGLVTLAPRRGKGGAHAPSVPYEQIHVTIDLRQAREAQAD